MVTSRREESMLGPYRVLDLADRKALMTGKILGCLGADVIKVERPGGDPARNIGPFYKDQVHPEKSLYWFYLNTSKRGITLDITKPDGQALFKELVKTTDVVVESFEPGYMASLGLGYEDLCQVKPDIVMTSVSPFGQTGPYAQFKHSNLTTWSMSGQTYITGVPEREPVGRHLHTADFHGGLHAAIGTLMALTHRSLTGEGQFVDVSAQQSVILTLMIYSEYWDILKVVQKRVGSISVTPRPTPPGPLRGLSIFTCKDGYLNTSGIRYGSRGNVDLSTALVKWANSNGYMQELADVDWSTYSAMTITQEERDRIDRLTTEFFMSKTKKELMERSAAENLQLAPCNNVADLWESPHFRARGFWDQVVEHPELNDAFPYPGAPVDSSEAPWRIWRRAPLIGEHNEELYCGEMGISKEQLALLKANEVI